jgi:uncharacterized glyoxalase superfamily protein PhnB
MHADVEERGRTIVPTLRYRDVAAAIDWLCKAFGFERHLVVPDDNGSVRYAELTFGDGMIMLGPVQDSAFDKLMTQPEDAGGAETQICYLFVEDAGAHRTRAKAAGAEIVLDIEEEGGGGRGYSCRDPEGHIWNFGTYNPWKRHIAHADRAGRRTNAGRGLRRVALAAGLLLTVAASALAVEWAMGATPWPSFESEPVAATDADATAKSEQEQLARAIKEAREQLAKERSAKETAERAARAAREQLAQERQAKETAERAKEAAERAAREAREQIAKAGTEQTANEVREMREQLAREKSALANAQRIAEETREQLALTERAAEAMQEQLAAERGVREAAERLIQQAQEQQAREQSAKEESERAKQQAREKAAKERASKEAERAAEEARERARNARRAVPRAQAAAEPMPTPFTGRSDN